MCRTRVLSTKDQTVVSSCVSCKVYYLWHSNLLLNFSEEAFRSFRDMVHSMPFYTNSLPFPDGSERIVLHTPHDDISFAFNFDEFETFKQAINEGIYMNEVYSLMNS